MLRIGCKKEWLRYLELLERSKSIWRKFRVVAEETGDLGVCRPGNPVQFIIKLLSVPNASSVVFELTHDRYFLSKLTVIALTSSYLAIHDTTVDSEYHSGSGPTIR